MLAEAAAEASGAGKAESSGALSKDLAQLLMRTGAPAVELSKVRRGAVQPTRKCPARARYSSHYGPAATR